MIQICPHCATTYDDVYRLTFCPHNPVGDAVDVRRKLSACALLGGRVRRYDPDGPRHNEELTPISVSAAGWITFLEIPGEHDPHDFRRLVGR